jgi:GT2 family glycosyltransferase
VSLSSPELSVVIAAVNETSLLRDCLEALRAQAGPQKIEIVVVDRAGGGEVESLRLAFPDLILIAAPARTIPQMRAEGLKRATAPLIGFLEDHTNVVPTWLESMRRGHGTGAGAVGGSVTNGCFTMVDWAAFFVEYNEHMTPMPAGEVPSLPGNNVSYKRSAIEACGDLFYRGLWETFLHAALADKGFRFRCESGAEVIHAKPFSFAHFAEQRWHLARSYAGMRVRDFSTAKRLLYAAASPLLLPLLTARVVRRVLARPGNGYLAALIKCFPLLLLFLSIWTVAEFVGYAWGEGNSSLKVV